MFKYVSIDIETTGLDPEKHQILEFAAVYNDLGDPKPIEKLPFFVREIRWDDYVINEYNLESELLKRIKLGLSGNIITIDTLAVEFHAWLIKLGLSGKYNVAGKNFGSFDAQFLRRVPGFPPWNYRILDVGSMYVTKDMDELPSLSDCVVDSVTKHRALPNALDVVRAVRGKLL